MAFISFCLMFQKVVYNRSVFSTRLEAIQKQEACFNHFWCPHLYHSALQTTDTQSCMYMGQFELFKEPSIRSSRSTRHHVGLLKHKWKTLSQSRKEFIRAPSSWTCLWVHLFSSFLITNKLHHVFSFSATRTHCQWALFWCKYWRSKCSSASLSPGSSSVLRDSNTLGQ